VTATGCDQPGLRPGGRRAGLARTRTRSWLPAGQRLVVGLTVFREFGSLGP